MKSKRIFRSIAIVSLFLIPILPLIVSYSLFFPFITGKAVYFRMLAEIAFVSWVILALYDPAYRPRLRALTVGVTVFTLVTLIADLTGVNPIRSLWSNLERMDGWITTVHLWMFYMAMTGVFGAGDYGMKQWHRWMRTFLTVGVLVAGYGFAQIFGWAEIHQGSVRIDASLGNAAYMAVYMLVNVGLSVYLLLTLRTSSAAVSFWRWVYVILAVMFSFLLFATATRSAIIGLVGGVVLALLLYAVFGKNEPRNRRLWAVAAIGTIALIGAVFWLNRDTEFVRDNYSLSRLGTISLGDTRTQARGYVWPMAIEGWKERPILGWGQENFGYIFNERYDPHMWIHEEWFDRAHSVFLDWLVASGILGLLSYVSLYILALAAVWRSVLTVAGKSVFTGLIAGYAVYSIFFFDSMSSHIAFFALLAFAASADGRGFSRTDLSSVRVLGGTREVSANLLGYIIVPVSAIVLSLSLYFFNIRVAVASAHLINATRSCVSDTPNPVFFEKVFRVNSYVVNQEAREQLVLCSSSVVLGDQNSPDIRKTFHDMARRAIDDQIASSPDDARMYYLGGVFLNDVHEFEQARSLLDKAYLLMPAKQEVKIQLARNYLNTGDIEQALDYLKSAYESDPSNQIVQGYYVLGLIIADDAKQAREILKDDLASLETEYVADLYVSLGQYERAAALYGRLVSKDRTNLDLRVRLAKAQYSAGMKAESIQTLKSVQKDFPELTGRVEILIRQIK